MFTRLRCQSNLCRRSDRIGSRILYGGAIILWEYFTRSDVCLHHLFATATASFAMLLARRALIGVAEAPSFPRLTTK